MSVSFRPFGIPHLRQGPGGRFVALGFLIMAVSAMMLVHLPDVATSTLSAVGVAIALTGLVQTGHGFSLLFKGHRASWALRGSLQILAGLAIWFSPVLALVNATLLASGALIVSGGLGMFLALDFETQADWLVASGFLDLLAGFIVVVGWPIDMLWVPGVFLAVAVLMHGAAFAAIGLALSRQAQNGPG